MIKTDNALHYDEGLSPFYSIKSVITGVVSAYIFLIPVFVALALVYTYTPMPDSYVKPAVTVISILSILWAGFCASAKAKSKGWLHGCVSGLIYALVRIGIGFAVFGKYVPSASIAETLMVTAAIATLGGILGVNFSARRKKR